MAGEPAGLEVLLVQLPVLKVKFTLRLGGKAATMPPTVALSWTVLPSGMAAETTVALLLSPLPAPRWISVLRARSPLFTVSGSQLLSASVQLAVSPVLK